MAAASAGDLPRLQALLAHQPDLVTARTRLPCAVASGYAALHFAAASAHLACLNALLAAGAPPDTADDRGATPLHWAAGAAAAEAAAGGGSGGAAAAVREAVLSALLAAGASVDARDEDGETALHQAARLGNQAAIRCLVSAGADLLAVNQEGLTPRTLAYMARQGDAVDLLEALQAQRAVAAKSQATMLEGLFGREMEGKQVRVWWAERSRFLDGRVTRVLMPDRVHLVRFEGVDPRLRFQRLRLHNEVLELRTSDGHWRRYHRGRLQQPGIGELQGDGAN